jgi:phosphate transport system substrate-binding protein
VTPALAAVKISGSGSTFIKPIMDKWIQEYRKEHPDVEINYQGLGSGAGVKQMTEKAVDFGCTDAFIKKDVLSKLAQKETPVVHVPLAMGAIVIAYNVPGVSKEKPLTFSGQVLGDIYLGKITKWNDSAIRDLNKGVELPDLEISVVQRSDSSGSTAIFTEFLYKTNEVWKKSVGTGTTVKWPVGTGEMGTAGVAGAVTKNAGSIGYVELFYALKNNIAYGDVVNKAGVAVKPTLDSVSAAAKSALENAKNGEFPEDLRFTLVNVPGKDAYPISGTTWAVLYQKPGENADELVKFLDWVTQKRAQDLAAKMDYAPLPEELAKLVKGKLGTVKTDK